MQKILVTGAGGFVGGWVVESFQRAGIPVRAGLRRWNSAVRLARQPTELVPCDVLAPAELQSAMADCDAVVHCAVGNQQVTIEGTRNLLEVARRLNVRRVVHLSSVAVYGKTPGQIRESSGRLSHGDVYAQAKIAAEELCEQFAANGLPVVMLRPSIVYGPFSTTWTVSFGYRLCSGTWGTFGPMADGKCNLVYVTDVVQAVYLALFADCSPAESFNINGDEVITWNEYFVRFNEMLGRAPLSPLNTRRIAAKARIMAPVRRAARFALSRLNPLVMNLHAQSAWMAKTMKVTESSLRLTPTSDQLKLYGLDAKYHIDKARAVLGYAPKVGISEGLAHSVAWLRQQGLVDGGPGPREFSGKARFPSQKS